MTGPSSCSRCGHELPAGAPADLCPQCLLAQGLALLPTPSELATPPIDEFSGTRASGGTIDGHATGAFPVSLGSQGPVRVDARPAGAPTRMPFWSPGVLESGARVDRYEFFGEIARGGMGAVLMGRDVELGRDLAIKVLLESHCERPEHVSRFVEEAQIGCQLQHPGIVPVYDLGTLPDRRPFFTMKLVRGRTLAEMLRERPDPGHDRPRFLAIFEQICQTVAYAHAREVIHRDLKPSNVMVGAFGEVQVMDWGLAKVLHSPGATARATEPGPDSAEELRVRTIRSGSDADASRAGAVMGTASYMAPEQARGEIDRLDERADVFALGAILCEILTGRPPFVGPTGPEVVRKAAAADLADAEARLTACGAAPPLLEMARRCLATDPADRPRDAGEVAGAMTSYLAGVQERLRAAELARVEAQARAEEVRKRRRAERRLSAGLLAVLAVGTAGVASQWRRAEVHLASANAANAELTRANAREVKARDQALARLTLAMEAIDRYYTGASRELLLNEPGMEGLRARLLGSALDYYKKLESALESEPGGRTRVELAEAYRRVGEITASIGAKPAALDAYERALAIRSRLARDHADDPEAQSRLAKLRHEVGVLLSEMGRGDESLRALEEARTILERLVRDHPDRPEYSGELAQATLSLANVLSYRMGRHDEALRMFERSVTAFERLARDQPGVARYRRTLGISLANVGLSLRFGGRAADSLRAYEEAVAVLERLARDDPDDQSTQFDLARTRMAFGTLLGELGRGRDARLAFQEAERIFERLSRATPNMTRFQGGLAQARHSLGWLHAFARRWEQALGELRRALPIRDRLARDHPRVTEFQADLAQSHLQIGHALSELNRPAEALPELQRAEEIHRRLANENPSAPAYQSELAGCHMNTASLQAALNHPVEAAESYRRAVVLYEGFPAPIPGDLYNLACAHARLAVLGPTRQGGRGSEGRGGPDDHLGRAMAALQRAAAGGFRDATVYREDPDLEPLRPRADFRALLLDLTFPADPFGP